VTRREAEGRRRRDRRAQLAVVLLAIAAGVTAGLLGTHRSWEQPRSVSTTTTTTLVPMGANGGLP
jgi:hypothetical protein